MPGKGPRPPPPLPGVKGKGPRPPPPLPISKGGPPLLPKSNVPIPPPLPPKMLQAGGKTYDQIIKNTFQKLVFTFDSLDLSGQIKEAISKKQKTVNMKGFRKGKAPVSMVEQMYGPQIESEALNNFIQSQ